MKKIYFTIQLTLLVLITKAQFCNPGFSSISVSSTTACPNGVITCSASGGTLPSGAYYNWRAYYTSGASCNNSSSIDFGQQGSPINVVNGSQFTMPATGQNTYYIRLTAVCSNGVRGCASTEIAVSRAGAPVIMTPNTQVAFCPGTPVSIAVTVTAGATYSWTKDGATVSGANTPTLNFASPTATNAGIYRCLATNACGTTTSSAITFTTLGNQTIFGTANTATNTTRTYSVTNQSSQGVTYNWALSGGGTITSATNTNSISVDWGNTAGTQTLSLDKTLGSCQVTDTKTISIEECTTNTVNITINGIITNTVCEGSTVNLYPPSQGPTYSWSNGANNFAISITPTANVTYSIAYTDNVGCAKTGTIDVVVNSLPQFSISATSTNICPNQTATLSIVGGTNVASYDWGIGGGANVNSTYEVNHNDVAATYTITANAYNGSYQCKTTQTIAVTAYLNPTVTVVASNTNICSGENTTLTPGGATSYTWNPSIPSNNVASPTTNTTYTLTGANAGGCTDENQITINVQTCTGINELNGNMFSIYPNPAKDYLLVEGINNTTYTLINILGEVVQSGNIADESNSINISKLNQGVYFININNKSVKRFIKE